MSHNGGRILMGSATFWKRLHLVMFWVWVVLLPPSLLWWRESIPYLVLMSWYAIAIGHISSWQASRAEQEAEGEGDADDDDARRTE